MESIADRVVRVLCIVVKPLPVGTNRAFVDLCWMMLSGGLLASRGALLPALSALGWSAARVRRAWAALSGAWMIDEVLTAWRGFVMQEGQWEAHTYEGYQPVAVDLTGFWRPRLKHCPTTHYHSEAGRALPAIPLGLIARVGEVGGQRLALPLGIVRADSADPTPSTHRQRVLTEAVARSGARDVLVVDREFRVAALQAAKATRYLARAPQNLTARRRTPPPAGKRGRPATRGVVVRPLARTYRGKTIAATPPDAMTTWEEAGQLVRAETWTDLILPETTPEEAKTAPGFTVVAIHHPDYPTRPLLLATTLTITPQTARDLYADRWPIEQLPLAAKQMVGAARQFVSAPETCQRLPELSIAVGAMLSYLAATTPAPATGFWDRRPQPTPGRFRLALSRISFPELYRFPSQVREKAAVTEHLPTGFWDQRRPRTDHPLPPAAHSGTPASFPAP